MSKTGRRLDADEEAVAGHVDEIWPQPTGGRTATLVAVTRQSGQVEKGVQRASAATSVIRRCRTSWRASRPALKRLQRAGAPEPEIHGRV